MNEQPADTPSPPRPFTEYWAHVTPLRLLAHATCHILPLHRLPGKPAHRYCPWPTYWHTLPICRGHHPGWYLWFLGAKGAMALSSSNLHMYWLLSRLITADWQIIDNILIIAPSPGPYWRTSSSQQSTLTPAPPPRTRWNKTKSIKRVDQLTHLITQILRICILCIISRREHYTLIEIR